MEQWAAFETSYRHANRRRWARSCHWCGNERDAGRCYYCDNRMPLPEWLPDRVWREAIRRCRDGWTAREFFNKISLPAKVALMRELQTRWSVAQDGLGRMTPTLVWLKEGLQPDRL